MVQYAIDHQSFIELSKLSERFPKDVSVLPIRCFGVLADDVHAHVLWHFVQRFRMALLDSADFLDY